MNPPSTSRPSGLDPYERDLALHRYDVIMKYLAFEHTIYWARSHFFLAANTGLFGLAVAKFPTSDFRFRYLAGPVVVAIVGLALSIVWRLALWQAGRYADRWRGLCQQLEPLAFEGYEVLRNPPKSKLKLRALGSFAAWLFILLWVLVIIVAARLWWLRPDIMQPVGGYPGWC